MPGVLQEQIAVTMPQLILPFQATNVGDADITMKAVEPTSNEYRMTRAGWIVGISVQHNADLTGGVQVWSPTVNGTAKTALSATTDDTHQGATAVCQAGDIPFAAGDLIGIKSVHTTTVAPTTTDVAAYLDIVYADARL